MADFYDDPPPNRAIGVVFCALAVFSMLTVFHAIRISSDGRPPSSAQDEHPSLDVPGFRKQAGRMTLLSSEDFARMERLLAQLLSSCDDVEEQTLLQLHARLQVIYAAQSGLQASRDRLMALQSQTQR